MNYVRHIRSTLGWTQPQLAAHLGVSAATISRYETGDQAISEPVSKLLANLRKSRKVLREMNMETPNVLE